MLPVVVIKMHIILVSVYRVLSYVKRTLQCVDERVRTCTCKNLVKREAVKLRDYQQANSVDINHTAR